MAQASHSIFNQRATEKLRSPDDLDKYVQVTNPNVWVILVACISLLVGLFAWGFFGSVTTSVASTGVVVDGQAMCFLPAEGAARVHVGDSANVGGETMELAGLSTVPLSREEARQVLGSDYLVATLLGADWGYQVTFEGDASSLPAGVPLAVNITTERVAPMSLLLLGGDER